MKKNIYSLTKTYLAIVLFLMMSSLLKINFSSAPISYYMLFVIFITLIHLKSITISSLYFYEIIFITIYMYIALSSLWSIDVSLSLKLIIGESILLLSYFIIRFLVMQITLKEFENIFLNLAKTFTILSFILYLYGIYYYYLSGSIISESMHLNESALGIYGLYFEGYLPRFRGLSESPNNYFYIEFLLVLFFIYKKKLDYAILGIISIVLTVSSTAILVMLLSFSLNFFNKKHFFKFSIIALFIFGFFFLLYTYNDYIHDLLIYRSQRNATGSGRFELWLYIVDYIAKQPLFGYGANTSRVILENLRHFQSAHNSFLDIMLTTGIIGLLLEIFLFFMLFNVSRLLGKFYDTTMFMSLWILYFIISMANNTLHIVYVILYLSFVFTYYNNFNYKRKKHAK